MEWAVFEAEWLRDLTAMRLEPAFVTYRNLLERMEKEESDLGMGTRPWEEEGYLKTLRRMAGDAEGRLLHFICGFKRQLVDFILLLLLVFKTLILVETHPARLWSLRRHQVEHQGRVLPRVHRLRHKPTHPRGRWRDLRLDTGHERN